MTFYKLQLNKGNNKFNKETCNLSKFWKFNVNSKKKMWWNNKKINRLIDNY